MQSTRTQVDAERDRPGNQMWVGKKEHWCAQVSNSADVLLEPDLVVGVVRAMNRGNDIRFRGVHALRKIDPGRDP